LRNSASRLAIESVFSRQLPTWILTSARLLAVSAPARLSTDIAERRQVTVMFSDLVGSTALSARWRRWAPSALKDASTMPPSPLLLGERSVDVATTRRARRRHGHRSCRSTHDRANKGSDCARSCAALLSRRMTSLKPQTGSERTRAGMMRPATRRLPL
jgi:hypothetical protein